MAFTLTISADDLTTLGAKAATGVLDLRIANPILDAGTGRVTTGKPWRVTLDADGDTTTLVPDIPDGNALRIDSYVPGFTGRFFVGDPGVPSIGLVDLLLAHQVDPDTLLPLPSAPTVGAAIATAQAIAQEAQQTADQAAGDAADAKTIAGAASDAVAGKYAKPSGGIPKTDLAAAVGTSLGRADTVSDLVTTGRLSESALSDTIVASTEASFVPAFAAQQATNLIGRAAADRERSAAASIVRYTDAAQFTELFPTLGAWSTSALTVSGGQVIGVGSGVRGSSRGYATATGEQLVIKGQIVVVDPTGGSSSQKTLIGINNQSVGHAADDAATFVAIGVNGLNQPLTLIGWTGTSADRILSTTPLTPGTYYVTVVATPASGIDAAMISLTLTNADGTLEFRDQIPRTNPINNVMIWNGDGRGATGTLIGALGARRASATITPRASIEGLAPSAEWSKDSAGQLFSLTSPVGYDSRTPAPLILFAHGNDQSEKTLARDINVLYTAFLQAGFVVASSLLHGNQWGAQSAVDDMVRMYQIAKARHAIGPVFLLGQSMGGLTSLNALSQFNLPVAAWAGLYPVCDLRWMYDHLDAAAIRSAYGIASDGSDYDTKTAGHDPMKQHGSGFRGMPMRFYASPDDTRAPRVDHSDKLSALVSAYAPESTVVDATGQHSDPSHYQPDDLIAFYRRYGA